MGNKLAGSKGFIITLGVITLIVIAALIVWLQKSIHTITLSPARPDKRTMTQARILKVWDTGVTLNHNPQVGLQLEVQTPEQVVYQIETKLIISRLHLAQIKVGARIPVHFDPANPAAVRLALS